MEYKITQKVTELVTNLITAGYEGEATFTDSYCTGAASVLGNSFSIQLSGFCKETLNIVEDIETGEVVFVGRYNEEGRYQNPDVIDIVDTAWMMYKTYKGRDYSMPYEFMALFLSTGKLKEKKITKAVYEEQD